MAELGNKDAGQCGKLPALAGSPTDRLERHRCGGGSTSWFCRRRSWCSSSPVSRSRKSPSSRPVLAPDVKASHCRVASQCDPASCHL